MDSYGVHGDIWINGESATPSRSDTRFSASAESHLRWLERLRNNEEGLYSYNLFCVSRRDDQRLAQLHRAYFRHLRAIVAESEPSEVVALANLQLFSSTHGK